MKVQPFRFKQFTIHQDRSAMKVGTDGVLLGAWSGLQKKPNSILDIGAGTGVIALMLAQRCDAETIDAIEIDENAYEQCVENFEASPWADRLFCYHAGLDEFVDEMDEQYDLIVSNPPYFSPLGGPAGRTGRDAEGRGGLPMDVGRRKARFYDALPFKKLLEGVCRLLLSNGTFATVIPFKEEKEFLRLAALVALFPHKITRVKGNPASGIKRSLIQFGFEKIDAEENELIIEIERHQYTEEYIALTKDFYLKM